MAEAAPHPAGRWVYGPAPDLLFGCGLWYALVFPVLVAAGAPIREGGGATALPFLALLFGTPHYGATLLRVYERREDRRGYAVFGLWATLLLAVWFAAGVHDAYIGSCLLTVYITWSPWHYTGQNYGLAVMFLRRRGVPLPPHVKRFLYASFLLSYVMTFLAVHGGERASHYVPVAYEGSATYRFLGLGLPSAFADVGFAAASGAYAVALAGSAFLLLRRASLRAIAPAALLAASQALWFSVPLALRRWQIATGVEPWESDAGGYYFLWIAIAHSVQYLWITSWYAKARDGGARPGVYFAKVLLAGAALWAVPALVFAPGLLGRLPFDAGLGVLIASAANVHHFVLDGAIWKLRDGRVARVLLRRDEVRAPPPVGEPARGPWRPALAWGAGALCAVVLFGSEWEREVTLPRAIESADVARATRAIERLALVGRDSAVARLALGQSFERLGQPARAVAHYERAYGLHPTPEAPHALGALWARRGRFDLAADAYERSLALDPEREPVLYALGLARLELDQPELAREAFERAAALRPDRKINRTMLARAEEALRAREHPP